MACPASPENNPPPDDEQTIETPLPVVTPTNGAPTFPGTDVDAFGLQTTLAEADDDPDEKYPFNFVTNPLNVFHDEGETFVPFFLVRDVDNPANPNQGASPEGTASWTFDVSGFENLTMSVDIAAKGDFEVDDRFELTYQFDQGNEQTALGFAVDDTGVQTYELFNSSSKGTQTDTLFDPLVITDKDSSRTASNRFERYTAALTGSGSTLVLRLKVTQDGGSEMLALRNLVIKGTKAQ